ncbi:molecular chaperone [Salmonella enterica subsp. enterica]|uniref:Pilus assembly protein PapD n=1 Tax=Salmonella enterica subsp. enterica serovar Macclesfield str. S-1643 TaxID=1242107 RepID=A0A2C9NVB6_SALET|nr:fimbria/pilus periplasmic chaperone [Salmonella enterica]EAA5484610.1 molecular chaperone [Salmonella enterica subsp. enterica serovar Kouka]EBG2393153.1 molecular chaperone [Salmonella enterica subsp. enterica serovar Everleigh]EBS1106649.1 molecular chaperone [Salmonella enterica subsp. enterica serovar Eingedi]EBV2190873.1 molecular chaperone [Salmonella enterica subsp. enterica serovar Afula]ECH9426830.1 molecular chaperone [Salmonella enterica subsp. enterica]
MKFSARVFIHSVVFIVLGIFNENTLASAVISGTRIIYPSDSNEISVKIMNNGSAPILLQSWIDSGNRNARPSAIKVPFVLTPPINRVDAGKGQTLRISYTGVSLPVDRESVFWLNVLEIPGINQAKADQNTLQVAFRSRIKLFFRPAGLQGSANDAVQSIIWQAKGNYLEATNPTPFYVSFARLAVNNNTLAGVMVPPHSSVKVNIPGNAGSKISGAFVNDYGAVNAFSADIK